MATHVVKRNVSVGFNVPYYSVGGMIEVYTYGLEDGDSLVMNARLDGTDEFVGDIFSNGELSTNCVSRIPLNAGTQFEFRFVPHGGARDGGVTVVFSQERAPA